MRKKKDRRVNKFTNRRHSTLGLISCALDLVSIASIVGAFICAYAPEGSAGIFVGVAGMISLILSLLSMGVAIAGLKEDNTFNNLPGLGLVLAIITFLCWTGMLVLGAMM